MKEITDKRTTLEASPFCMACWSRDAELEAEPVEVGSAVQAGTKRLSAKNFQMIEF